MSIFEWVVSGGLLGLVGLLLKNNADYDKKICRVYKRLDDTKDYQESNFTRKDICAVVHKQIDDRLIRMDAKLDKILDGKNG